MISTRIIFLPLLNEISPFKKYNWNIPLSWISWNKGLLFSFAWKPNKWAFLCVQANCFQKAPLYCPVGSDVCLSHDESSVSVPNPDKWGVAQTFPLSKYEQTWFDPPSHSTFGIIECFYAMRNVCFGARVKRCLLCFWRGFVDCADSFCC